MRSVLFLLALLFALLALAWPWISRIPWGHLPGDLMFERPGLRLFFPLTTSLLLSVLASAVLWWLRR